MKYELDKEEFKAIHNTLLDLTKVLCGTVELGMKNLHEIRLKRLELETRRLEFEEAKEGLSRVKGISDFDDDSIHSEEDPLPFPQPAPDLAPEEPPVADNVIELDYVDFDAFMDAWLVNFNQEGPQPDRQKLLEDFVQHKGGGYFDEICDKSGGLTRAFFNYFRRKDPTYADVEFPFFVASNFTSVASLLYPPFCRHFKYVNPLTEQDI